MQRDKPYRPAFLITYLDTISGRELSLNLGSSINSTNSLTQYRSGSELFFTYTAQQHLSEAFALGLEGYYYRQIGDDTQNGIVVNTVQPVDAFHSKDPLNAGPGNHGEAFALGPTISYNPSADILLNAHWVHELFAYNRKQGDSLWVRATVRF
jgi:hypothetical protein